MAFNVKSDMFNKKSPSPNKSIIISASDTESGSKCPICSKTFPFSQIEGHVNRCLFLNSVNDGTSYKEPQTDKRKTNEEESVQSKKFCKNKELSNDPFTSVSAKEKGKELSSKMPTITLEGTAPLAEQMRPSSFEDYIGQGHVLGSTSLLRTLLNQNEIPSMILWGPPGCGKTSLAHIISKQCQSISKTQYRFVKLSATMAGVNDVKEAVKIAKNEFTNFKRQTILFMDEIHRFNKLQQDIFLPHIENGCIVLIGATTENPSFSLNSALLSRCRVFVLEKLASDDIINILTSAAQRMNICISSEAKDCNNSQLCIDLESLEWLAGMCDGDARIALNSLQMAVKTGTQTNEPTRITLENIQEGIKRSHLLYDKKGEEHYNIISALHKSIRASDENASLYWLARMLEGGEDPIFIARRLVVCASEDIGMEDPHALTMAMSAMQACQLIGLPECGLFLAHISTYLARAPKSRVVYDAFNAAKQCVRNHKGALPSVPLHLRNAPTKLMKQLGYGTGYNMRDKSSSNLTYMPEGMENVTFF
ncbi:ATPase WRNIP1-like isoform X1 [Macrosteles quadrilineatus]|uniref:ATPase WRNIP1-like isoform X1 n=1 Tax=Macrosteles quadrilineatus TaxID=74068 RepID=UPI0023E2EF8D|nr:ATPase WRNIP1-like isoform X1 [Macrosteles quadrilineatus]